MAGDPGLAQWAHTMSLFDLYVFELWEEKEETYRTCGKHVDFSHRHTYSRDGIQMPDLRAFEGGKGERGRVFLFDLPLRAALLTSLGNIVFLGDAGFTLSCHTEKWWRWWQPEIENGAWRRVYVEAQLADGGTHQAGGIKAAAAPCWEIPDFKGEATRGTFHAASPAWRNTELRGTRRKFVVNHKGQAPAQITARLPIHTAAAWGCSNGIRIVASILCIVQFLELDSNTLCKSTIWFEIHAFMRNGRLFSMGKL